MARATRLNVALTEAIALGHDCGHGPGRSRQRGGAQSLPRRRLRPRRLGRRRRARPAQPVRRDARRDPQPLVVAAGARRPPRGRSSAGPTAAPTPPTTWRTPFGPGSSACRCCRPSSSNGADPPAGASSRRSSTASWRASPRTGQVGMRADLAEALAALRALQLRAHLPPAGIGGPGRFGRVRCSRRSSTTSPTGQRSRRRWSCRRRPCRREPGGGAGGRHLRGRHDRPVRLPERRGPPRLGPGPPPRRDRHRLPPPGARLRRATSRPVSDRILSTGGDPRRGRGPGPGGNQHRRRRVGAPRAQAGGTALPGSVPVPRREERRRSRSTRSSGLYHCFGCGAGGDAIRFVREIEHLDFATAVERLAAKAGITLRYDDAAVTKDRQRRDRLVEAMTAAVDFYHQLLLDDPSAGIARRYLRSRGVRRRRRPVVLHRLVARPLRRPVRPPPAAAASPARTSSTPAWPS